MGYIISCGWSLSTYLTYLGHLLSPDIFIPSFACVAEGSGFCCQRQKNYSSNPEQIFLPLFTPRCKSKKSASIIPPPAGGITHCNRVANQTFDTTLWSYLRKNFSSPLKTGLLSGHRQRVLLHLTMPAAARYLLQIGLSKKRV